MHESRNRMHYFNNIFRSFDLSVKAGRHFWFSTPCGGPLQIFYRAIIIPPFDDKSAIRNASLLTYPNIISISLPFQSTIHPLPRRCNKLGNRVTHQCCNQRLHLGDEVDTTGFGKMQSGFKMLLSNAWFECENSKCTHRCDFLKPFSLGSKMFGIGIQSNGTCFLTPCLLLVWHFCIHKQKRKLCVFRAFGALC